MVISNYEALKTALKAEINKEVWATSTSGTSRPIDTVEHVHVHEDGQAIVGSVTRGKANES